MNDTNIDKLIDTLRHHVREVDAETKDLAAKLRECQVALAMVLFEAAPHSPWGPYSADSWLPPRIIDTVQDALAHSKGLGPGAVTFRPGGGMPYDLFEEREIIRQREAAANNKS